MPNVTFCDVLHEAQQLQKLKQIAESAQYRLKIIFNVWVLREEEGWIKNIPRIIALSKNVFFLWFQRGYLRILHEIKRELSGYTATH